jgi:hypothetical protein
MLISRKSFLSVVSLSAAAVATSGLLSDAHAQRAGYRWEYHKGANVKFEVKNSWVTTTEGDTLITKPKDGGLRIEFVAIIPGGGKIDDIATREINKRIVGAHVTESAKPLAQNGLTGAFLKGEGSRDGAAIEYFACFLGDGTGRGILSISFAKTGQIAAHRDSVVEIYNSIRPI